MDSDPALVGIDSLNIDDTEHPQRPVHTLHPRGERDGGGHPQQPQRDATARQLSQRPDWSSTDEVNRLDRLGGQYRRAGDMRAAEKAYRGALAVAEGDLATTDLTAARARNNLAVLLKYTGGFQEAATLYERSRRDLVAALGAEHPEVATVLHNIGGLAHAAGRPAEGEHAARESVRIRETALGAEHPEAAADRAALAAILDATGRHAEAAELLERALATFERALGPHHYEVAVTLANLGAIDARLGQLERAEVRLHRALAIKEQAVGPDHLELVPTLGTLGVVCRRRGDEIAARQLYERALRILDGRVVADHPHIATLQANLATIEAQHRPLDRTPSAGASPGRGHGRL